MRVDEGRARRIVDRLRASGDTPAARMIEALLAEREEREPDPPYPPDGEGGDR